jgi:integrase
MPREAVRDATQSDRAGNEAHPERQHVYALRFNANGRRQYVTLGSSRDGWNQAKAQDQLEHELACVEAGTWKLPEPESAPAVESDPTFHDFASDWFEAREDGWRPKTRRDYEWKLSRHLLSRFKDHRLSQITVSEVDRYAVAKRKQGTLSAASINRTVALLAQVLEVAVEYPEYAITANPARGRRRRLKADRPAAVWLDSAEQIAALLGAARTARGRRAGREKAPKRDSPDVSVG